MRRIKKVLNGFIAVCIANTPSIFPDSRIIMGVYIIGLIAICVAIYTILNKITIKENK